MSIATTDLRGRIVSGITSLTSRFSPYKVRYGNKFVYVFTSLTLYKGFYFGKQLSLKGTRVSWKHILSQVKAGRAHGDMGHDSVPGRSVLNA